MKNVIAVSGILALMAMYGTGCTGKRFKSRLSEEGYELAHVHCKSCHRFPEAALLDKKTWATYVLPKMSGFLGFRYMEGGTYFENGKTPETISLADWNKIVRYYVQEAPDAPEKRSEPINIHIGLKHFQTLMPAFRLPNPATTFVRIDPEQQRICFADGFTQHLYLLSNDGKQADSVKVGEGIVGVRMHEKSSDILVMGVLHPSDEKAGRLVTVPASTAQQVVLLDSLQRPVYVDYGHLNRDTLEDILVCEFGNTTGQLGWFEGKGNNRYQKHVLRPLPGAVRTQFLDAAKDGTANDIIALMAQGDEGFFIYHNQGNGTFNEQRVLQFSPSFGSNYFELADFNNDGNVDILATNGDNGDYPPILKAYHGVRIYLNDGNGNFTEKVFLPMNGASKAMAVDFDNDGDLDIASISYFPDYDHTPHESFIYWENKGGFSFQPYSFAEAAAGRWLTMDVGDLDNDGDADIVLGNARFTLGYIPEALMKRWNKAAPSVVVLKNIK